MGNCIDIQVFNSLGEPCELVNVHVFIHGLGLISGGSIDEYTDSDGHVSIETHHDYEPSREFTINVRGQIFGPYEIGGGDFTVQLE
jgi:hypothetical protein